MPDIPTIEPRTFARGDTVSWTKTLSDYPASTYTLTYEFRGATTKTVTASASGDDHAVTITAAQSLTWNEGDYWWAAYATTGAERYEVVTGTLTVTKNFAATDAVADQRSHAKKVLDAIEATIEGRASRDQQAYTIAGRSLALTPIESLLKLKQEYRAEYAKEVADEKQKRGEGSGKRILARLG